MAHPSDDYRQSIKAAKEAVKACKEVSPADAIAEHRIETMLRLDQLMRSYSDDLSVRWSTDREHHLELVSRQLKADYYLTATRRAFLLKEAEWQFLVEVLLSGLRHRLDRLHEHADDENDYLGSEISCCMEAGLLIGHFIGLICGREPFDEDLEMSRVVLEWNQQAGQLLQELQLATYCQEAAIQRRIAPIRTCLRTQLSPRHRDHLQLARVEEALLSQLAAIDERCSGTA